MSFDVAIRNGPTLKGYVQDARLMRVKRTETSRSSTMSAVLQRRPSSALLGGNSGLPALFD